jgi:hypothetical protein
MVDKRVRIVDGKLQFPSNFFVAHSVRVKLGDLSFTIGQPIA